jgi:hypothetical protein
MAFQNHWYHDLRSSFGRTGQPPLAGSELREIHRARERGGKAQRTSVQWCGAWVWRMVAASPGPELETAAEAKVDADPGEAASPGDE